MRKLRILLVLLLLCSSVLPFVQMMPLISYVATAAAQVVQAVPQWAAVAAVGISRMLTNGAPVEPLVGNAHTQMHPVIYDSLRNGSGGITPGSAHPSMQGIGAQAINGAPSHAMNAQAPCATHDGITSLAKSQDHQLRTSLELRHQHYQQSRDLIQKVAAFSNSVTRQSQDDVAQRSMLWKALWAHPESRKCIIQKWDHNNALFERLVSAHSPAEQAEAGYAFLHNVSEELKCSPVYQTQWEARYRCEQILCDAQGNYKGIISPEDCKQLVHAYKPYLKETMSKRQYARYCARNPTIAQALQSGSSDGFAHKVGRWFKGTFTTFNEAFHEKVLASQYNRDFNATVHACHESMFYSEGTSRQQALMRAEQYANTYAYYKNHTDVGKRQRYEALQSIHSQYQQALYGNEHYIPKHYMQSVRWQSYNSHLSNSKAQGNVSAYAKERASVESILAKEWSASSSLCHTLGIQNPSVTVRDCVYQISQCPDFKAQEQFISQQVSSPLSSAEIRDLCASLYRPNGLCVLGEATANECARTCTMPATIHSDPQIRSLFNEYSQLSCSTDHEKKCITSALSYSNQALACPGYREINLSCARHVAEVAGKGERISLADYPMFATMSAADHERLPTLLSDTLEISQHLQEVDGESSLAGRIDAAKCKGQLEFNVKLLEAHRAGYLDMAETLCKGAALTTLLYTADYLATYSAGETRAKADEKGEDEGEEEGEGLELSSDDVASYLNQDSGEYTAQDITYASDKSFWEKLFPSSVDNKPSGGGSGNGPDDEDPKKKACYEQLKQKFNEIRSETQIGTKLAKLYALYTRLSDIGKQHEPEFQELLSEVREEFFAFIDKLQLKYADLSPEIMKMVHNVLNISQRTLSRFNIFESLCDELQIVLRHPLGRELLKDIAHNGTINVGSIREAAAVVSAENQNLVSGVQRALEGSYDFLDKCLVKWDVKRIVKLGWDGQAISFDAECFVLDKVKPEFKEGQNVMIDIIEATISDYQDLLNALGKCLDGTEIRRIIIVDGANAARSISSDVLYEMLRGR